MQLLLTSSVDSVFPQPFMMGIKFIPFTVFCYFAATWVSLRVSSRLKRQRTNYHYILLTFCIDLSFPQPFMMGIKFIPFRKAYDAKGKLIDRPKAEN